MDSLHNQVERKFIKSVELDNWEVLSDTGWHDVTHFNKTIEYEVWEVITDMGTIIRGADTHIFINDKNEEIFLKDSLYHNILSENGSEKIISVKNLNYSDNMYDLTVDSDDHTYYTNGLLSHNTTCAAAYLLWYAMFVDDATVLIASNKFEGAQEIMHRIRYAYESIPDHIRAGIRTYNKRTLEFDNNSRIISTATTENTGRGLALSLVYLDEFSFVNYNIQRNLWSSLSPTLSTGGKCIITTTPNSDEDQFADIWFEANKLIDNDGNEREVGPNGFKPFKTIWSDVPGRDEAWAEAERATLGDAKFRIEHCCEFITSDETLIDPIRLSRLEGITPTLKTGQVRWYAPIQKDKTYIVGLDPSMGTGGDNSAIQVLELPTLIQVAEWHNNKTRIEDQVRTLRNILEDIYKQGNPEIYWSIESNSIGEAALVVIRDTGEENFHGTMLHDPKNKLQGRRRRAGFITTNKSKLESCAKLKSLVENDRLKIKSRNLISELKSFISKANSYEARAGQTDDLVMAMILVIRMIDYVATWDDQSQMAINSNIINSEEDDSDYGQPLPIFI